MHSCIVFYTVLVLTIASCLFWTCCPCTSAAGSLYERLSSFHQGWLAVHLERARADEHPQTADSSSLFLRSTCLSSCVQAQGVQSHSWTFPGSQTNPGDTCFKLSWPGCLEDHSSWPSRSFCCSPGDPVLVLHPCIMSYIHRLWNIIVWQYTRTYRHAHTRTHTNTHKHSHTRARTWTRMEPS